MNLVSRVFSHDKLTNLVEHLVTLVEDKDADTTEAEILVPNKGLQTTWGTDDDMRMGILVLKELSILGDRSSTVEHAGLDIRHVLAETVVLVANLEGQLASVAHNQHSALASHRLDLLEGGQDEDSCLTKTRLGLADNVTSEKSLGDTSLLDYRFRSDVRMKFPKVCETIVE